MDGKFQCPLRRAWVLRVYWNEGACYQFTSVSMPIKTGLGTAGVLGSTIVLMVKLFQCPLRRAWVLRGGGYTIVIIMDPRVSMPIKTGLGTAAWYHYISHVSGSVSMPIKTGLGTAGVGETGVYRLYRCVFQCPLRRAWVLRPWPQPPTPPRRTCFNAH